MNSLMWDWEFLSPWQPWKYFTGSFESLEFPIQPALPCLGGPVPCLASPLLSCLSPISTPPTGLGEYFFNSLVVGISCSLIFWHFWLFIVFKLGYSSFGCARKQSISTYASILARNSHKVGGFFNCCHLLPFTRTFLHKQDFFFDTV